MSAQESTVRRPSLGAIVLSWLFYGFVLTFIGAMLYLMWPALQARTTGAPMPALPTAAVVAPPAPPRLPVVAPDVQGAINNYNATAQAQYQQQASPVPNVNLTNDSAPLEVEQRAAPDRLPAGDNVPTAEPVVVSQGDDQTGSKPVLVNPQETHTCKHGQVWTDAGCKNP